MFTLLTMQYKNKRPTTIQTNGIKTIFKRVTTVIPMQQMTQMVIRTIQNHSLVRHRGIKSMIQIAFLFWMLHRKTGCRQCASIQTRHPMEHIQSHLFTEQMPMVIKTITGIVKIQTGLGAISRGTVR